ncbi:MAG: rhomboid family intramembrane serine protease [Rikenellaceae bacterium]
MSVNLIVIIVTAIVSYISFSRRDIFYALSLSPYNITHKGQWYRIVTHGFVHGSTTHLLVNMFVLWSFGSNVERIFNYISQDSTTALMLYLSLYIGALIFSSVYDIQKQKDNYNYNSIGASGAVTAVVFTSIFFSPWSKIYLFAIVPIPAILFGVGYLWYESYLARRSGDNINHYAHIFGAVFGFIFPIFVDPSLFTQFFSKLFKF